ncbi:diacylglycerol/lipid kinase family protein [Halomarina litorea]|uniref:diacylglycerol/lipid kinase family protein n=1 Tax=Halomarina litorea TaxID=2961595 RepID=UPI0020C3E6A0|nr:diacylglycerol kinase family protein [Halomarina sp. BCD28]
MNDRVLVYNPASGNRRAGRRAVRLATDRGFAVRESAGRGETRTLAREAATGGAELVVACGGDGTLNEVVRGVYEADALARTRLGVVPGGTGNDFADNIGITSVGAAFDALDGPARRLDLGTVEERGGEDGPVRPFCNSCVGGLTANASARATPDRKRRLGVLAYVLTTFAESRSFEGLELDVRAGPREDPLWSGRALMVLVGNARRFPGERRRPANVEDGLLNVVIIERAPALDYLAQGAADRLLRRGASHLTRVRVPQLSVRHAGGPVTFSLDGELVSHEHVVARCLPGAMRFHVGANYRPHPPEDPSDDPKRP